MYVSNSHSSCRIQHVKFGRVSGMSTRKGTSVLLADILEEAKQRMIEKMCSTNSKSTTVLIFTSQLKEFHL